MGFQIDVVKGRMCGNDFYLGSMTFSGIDKYVLAPDDERWDRIFKGAEDAQRKLNKRRVTSDMVPYLTKTETNPFFSALTLILIPLTGEKLEEGEGKDFQFEPSAPGSMSGKLHIGDHVHMFPGDGQHRAEAISEALLSKSALHREYVPVVLMPFTSKERVRQLFSDLNLNAKLVSKTIGLAFETRDPVVVLTKRLMQDIPLFKGNVNEKSNSLSVKSSDVITMNALNTANTEILKALYPVGKGRLRDHPELAAIEQADPDSPLVGKIAEPLADVWEVIIRSLPEWERVLSKHVSAGVMREGDPTKGTTGYVFAYGIGWQAIAQAAAALITHRPDDWTEDLERSIRAVDWTKHAGWQGVAMIGTRVNNTAPGVKATAGLILEAGGFKDEDGVEIQSLLRALASSRAQLPTGAEVEQA